MNTKKCLTGSTLKIIAITTMLIDHIGAIILELGLIPAMQDSVLLGFSTDYIPSQLVTVSMLDMILRIIGRVAFPLFLFLLVEGFLHTSNVYKYLLRLFIFALLSELPFNIALTTKFIDWNLSSPTCTLMYQSVYVTLFLSLLMMVLIELINDKFSQSIVRALLTTFTIIIIAAVAELLHTDYGMLGIAMAAVMYLCRNNPGQRTIFTFLAIAAYSAITMDFTMIILESFGLLAFVFIRYYNGERGSFKLKYFFYLFYPVHLLILSLIRYALFN